VVAPGAAESRWLCIALCALAEVLDRPRQKPDTPGRVLNGETNSSAPRELGVRFVWIDYPFGKKFAAM
jgi:hypothetical protein